MVGLGYSRAALGSGALRAMLLMGAAIFPSAAHANCDGLLPAAIAQRAVRDSLRPVTGDDLVRLRDLGPADGSETGKPSALAVSPDAKEVAFVLSRADPDGNRYCRALVVLALDRSSPPRVLDSGGDYMFDAFPMYGRILRNGFTAVVTPQWSPDGNSIAYLRRGLWPGRRQGADMACAA